MAQAQFTKADVDYLVAGRATGDDQVNKIIDSILKTYLTAYEGLLAVEMSADGSATISFPFHIAGGHRIEVTITDLNNGQCLISDAARTIGELRAAGHSLSSTMMRRAEKGAILSGLRIVEETLLLEVPYGEVGTAIQKFLEAAKTISDVLLTYDQFQMMQKQTGVLETIEVLTDDEERSALFAGLEAAAAGRTRSLSDIRATLRAKRNQSKN